MSKATLAREIHKELERLNQSIDEKILKGQRFSLEARRHKELLATLRRIEGDTRFHAHSIRRMLFRTTSPVRRSIERGVVARLFTFRMA